MCCIFALYIYIQVREPIPLVPMWDSSGQVMVPDPDAPAPTGFMLGPVEMGDINVRSQHGYDFFFLWGARIMLSS